MSRYLYADDGDMVGMPMGQGRLGVEPLGLQPISTSAASWASHGRHSQLPSGKIARVARERTRLQRALVGPAGEHYVLFRLYQQGLLASLAPPGAPTVDILVLSPDEDVIADVQVKTRTSGRDGGWHMKAHHERMVRGSLFYAFVDLRDDASPVTYIVPSATVAEVLQRSHASWLSTPGRSGRQHRDHAMRRILPDYGFDVPGYPAGWLDDYRECWNLLGGFRPVT